MLLGAGLASRVADWLVQIQLMLIWRWTRSDICHVHWVDGRLAVAAKASLRPLVVTAYGSDMNGTRSPSYDAAQLLLIKQGLAKVDLFIADSEDMIDIARELAGREIPSLLLPIGIDTNLFRPGYEDEASVLRAELGIPVSARVIFSPRLLRPNYRQVELVQAFAEAVHRHGLDGYLILKNFLGYPEYIQKIREMITIAGVSERVRIVDEVAYEQLPALYAMADLAVNYPAMDAFPATFLEAAACQLPVLSNHLRAYDSNGMGHFLHLFRSDDPSVMGADMARLCDDRGARELSQVARTHVAANYSEQAFVTALMGAYAKLKATRRC